MVAPPSAPKIANWRHEKHEPESQHQSAPQSCGNDDWKRWANWAITWIRLIQTSDNAGRQGGRLACSHVSKVFLRFGQRFGLLADVGELIGVFRSKERNFFDAIVDVRQFLLQRLKLRGAHLEIGIEVADYAIDFGIQLIANFLLGEQRGAKFWMVGRKRPASWAVRSCASTSPSFSRRSAGC